MFVWEVGWRGGGWWDGERKEQRVEGLSWGRECRGSGRDTPGRGLFCVSAPADSYGQEFSSSFCHRANAPSSVTKTCRSTAAAGNEPSAAHTLLPLRWNFESVISCCRFLSFLVEPALDAPTLEKTPLQEETFVSLQGLLPAGGSQHHLQCVDFNKGARHPVQFFVNVKE